MRILAALIVAASLALPGAARAQQLTVFAAASLTDALEEAGRIWAARGNPPVRFSFAASSALARQIEAGAPADVFASADEAWMDHLERRGRIAPGTRASLLSNRLVLVAPAGSRAGAVEVRRGLELAALAGDGRIAAADPDHVPAGRYAREALQALGLWDAAAPRLARADNVRVAIALVERGEVPLGIVYSTDAAAARGVRVLGAFPADSHAPISYPFAAVARRDGEAARAFLAFLASEEAAAVFRRHGFGTGQ